jgi:hypothetical protein
MRNRWLLVSMAWLASPGGCVATPPAMPGVSPETPPPAAAGSEIRLQAGQEAAVAGADFRIAFAGVDGDSRCAKGETCVWEGNAAVRLTITGASGKQALTMHTSRRSGPDHATHRGWTIRLVALEPQPIIGRAIEPAEYVATLSIEPGDSGPAAR